ncbi:MAG: CsbD family protein [bacterium]|jgi:uncharacterized protein YjbJ (UPF0337 family)
MNWDQLEGNWKQFQGKIQAKWGELTNDDLDVIHGNRKQLIGRIREKYGMKTEEAEREVDTFISSL